MMALVRLCLRRPYTSAIAAMLIVLMGGLAVTRMIVDIFPIIDIPVVLVAWNYPGLSAEDMERRVVLIRQGLLVAGSFVYVTLHLPIKSYPEVPVAALVARANKSFVARVDDAGEIHFLPVTIGATDGRVVAVTSGLAGGERVALNLPADVTDGSRIQPVQIASQTP